MNPARELAVITGSLVHCSDSVPGVALASLASTLWAMRGRVSASLSLAELADASRYYQGPHRDIFYDPLLDGDGSVGLPLKPIVWCAVDADVPGLPGAIAVTSVSNSVPVSVLRLLARAFAATVFFSTE